MKTQNVKNQYFTAVVDVKEEFGFFNKMEHQEPDFDNEVGRTFNAKFVNNPKMALYIAVFNYFGIENGWKTSKMYDEKFMDDFIKSNFTYNKESGVFTNVRFFTTGGNEPKPGQMKKFMNGEYEFSRMTVEIQVLRTDLVIF